MGVSYRDSEAVLSKEYILSRTTEEQLFIFYCRPFKGLGVKFSSELREDPIPSCRIDSLRRGLSYKDYGERVHNFDVFGYVMYKYDLNFINALKRISSDLELGLVRTDVYVAEEVKRRRRRGSRTRIGVKLQALPYNEGSYWDCFLVQKSTLQLFKVRSVRYYWIGNIRFSGSVTFAYCEHSPRLKIYSPLKIEFKWFCNTGTNDIQGSSVMPRSGDSLVITSSLKDVMCLYELGITAVAPQSENAALPDKFIAYIKKHFKNIYVLYDNDFNKKENAGQREAENLCKEHSFRNIKIPDAYQVTDVAEMMERYGPIETYKLWLQKEERRKEFK